MSSGKGSFPHLSGKLLWLYRGVYCALVMGAVAATFIAALQSAAHPELGALQLVKSAVLICVAGILFHRRQRDPVAALLALAFLTWTITSSFSFGAYAAVAGLLDRCRFLLFALALLLFPDGRWQPRWARSAAFGSIIVFLIGVAEALQLLPTHCFLPLAITCVLAAIGSLVSRFRAATDLALKQQLKWVALGLVAGVGMILVARAGSARFAATIPGMPILWEVMLQLGIMIVALGFLVSLLRYRLFDAETVISRSAAYATLTIAIIATFGGTEAFIQNVGQAYLGMDIGGVSGGMAAAVAAVLLNPLHERITNWAEHRFQPDLAQLRREVPESLQRFGTADTTRRLCETVLPQINLAIHATRSALIVHGQVVGASGIALAQARKWAAHSFSGHCGWNTTCDGDPVFPVRLPLSSPASAEAWLIVGPRPDGSLYGKGDLDAVRSILPSIQGALRMTRARAKIAANIKRREQNLRREIADIRLRLHTLEHSPNGLQRSDMIEV